MYSVSRSTTLAVLSIVRHLRCSIPAPGVTLWNAYRSSRGNDDTLYDHELWSVNEGISALVEHGRVYDPVFGLAESTEEQCDRDGQDMGRQGDHHDWPLCPISYTLPCSSTHA